MIVYEIYEAIHSGKVPRDRTLNLGISKNLGSHLGILKTS